MRSFKRLFAGLSLLLLAGAAPALAQTVLADPPDPWVHAATRTAFPARVGAFARDRVVEYSDDGTDASAGYNLRRGNDWVIVTLYVYPAPAGVPCQAMFDDVKSHVQAHPGATLVSEGLEPAPSGRGGPVAHHARYALPAGSIGAGAPVTRSEAYLYCPAGGKWLVKYRATWNAAADFSRDVETLLHSIAWPAPLGG